MYKIVFSVLVAFMIITQACQKEGDFETTDSGLKYRYLSTSEDGQTPQDGEIIVLNLRMVNASDSVLVDATEMPLQKNEAVWNQAPGGIEEAFSLLSLGDSMVVKINAKDLYERTWRMPLPPDMDPAEEITCNVKLTEIFDEATYQRNQAMSRVAELEAYREQVLLQSSEQMEADGETIDKYLAKNNIAAQTTETGLRYVIVEEGNGENPKVGDQVQVNYTGNVLEGDYFDSSVEEKAREFGLFDERRTYGPFEFILGTGGVIHGWDEGIALLSKGGKARLFIPSPMGYGDQQRSEVIVPNSILEFEVELVEIISN